jgi:hypothetical protein
MSDPNEEQPRLPASGISLGGLGAGEYDRSLRAGEGEDAEADGADREDEGADLEDEGAEAGAPPARSVAADEEKLTLPRNGLVAFRKSGGLRFTSRGFVVYRSGWVVPLEGTGGRPRHMTEAAREAVEALLLRSGMSRTHRKRSGGGDGYAYEITARYGGRTRYAEFHDGAIPEEMRRLVEVLQRLMPKE